MEDGAVDGAVDGALAKKCVNMILCSMRLYVFVCSSNVSFCYCYSMLACRLLQRLPRVIRLEK